MVCTRTSCSIKEYCTYITHRMAPSKKYTRRFRYRRVIEPVCVPNTKPPRMRFGAECAIRFSIPFCVHGFIWIHTWMYFFFFFLVGRSPPFLPERFTLLTTTRAGRIPFPYTACDLTNISFYCLTFLPPPPTETGTRV